MDPFTEPVVIMLGANVGNRFFYISQAKEKIQKQIGQLKMQSLLYETAAWGNENQSPFLNQVVVIETLFDPENLLLELLKIEEIMGRIRDEKWAPRTIDLDILFYGNRIIDIQELTIPHPRLTDRRFTLMPLAELLPYFVHPLLKINMKQLLIQCQDSLAVRAITDLSKTTV